MTNRQQPSVCRIHTIHIVHMSTVLEKFKSWQRFQGALRALFQSSVRCAKYQSDLQTFVRQSNRTFIFGQSFKIANSNVTAAQVFPVPAGPWITAISCVKAVWAALICKNDEILQCATPTSVYWLTAFQAFGLQQHPYEQKCAKFVDRPSEEISGQIGHLHVITLKARYNFNLIKIK